MSCPICRKPVAPDYRPFCSRRCADVDLGRWVTGSYSLPGPAMEDEDAPDLPRPASDRDE